MTMAQQRQELRSGSESELSCHDVVMQRLMGVGSSRPCNFQSSNCQNAIVYFE